MNNQRRMLVIGLVALAVLAVVKSFAGTMLTSDEDKFSYANAYAVYSTHKGRDEATFEKDLEAQFGKLQKPPFTDAYKAGARDAFHGKASAVSNMDALQAVAKIQLRYPFVIDFRPK